MPHTSNLFFLKKEINSENENFSDNESILNRQKYCVSYRKCFSEPKLSFESIMFRFKLFLVWFWEIFQWMLSKSAIILIVFRIKLPTHIIFLLKNFWNNIRFIEKLWVQHFFFLNYLRVSFLYDASFSPNTLGWNYCSLIFKPHSSCTTCPNIVLYSKRVQFRIFYCIYLWLSFRSGTVSQTFLRFSWPWHFWRLQASCSVKCASVWVIQMFPHE